MTTHTQRTHVFYEPHCGAIIVYEMIASRELQLICFNGPSNVVGRVHLTWEGGRLLLSAWGADQAEADIPGVDVCLYDPGLS